MPSPPVSVKLATAVPSADAEMSGALATRFGSTSSGVSSSVKLVEPAGMCAARTSPPTWKAT